MASVKTQIKQKTGRPPKIPDSYLRNVNLARQLLRDHTMQAAQVFIEALEDPSIRVRMEAAKEILSRAGIPITQVVEYDPEVATPPLVIRWQAPKPEPVNRIKGNGNVKR